MRGIIFIAHGSKKEKSNNEFLELIENISKKDTNYDLKKAAFLETAQPSIDSCVDDFIDAGAKEIYLYPFFLNSGKHVLIDLPEIVSKLKNKYDDVEFFMFEHFGKSVGIEGIILEDIRIK